MIVKLVLPSASTKMAIKVNGTTVIHDSKKADYQSLNPGVYTTETLPGSPEIGDVIYNSTEQKIQAWTGGEWK